MRAALLRHFLRAWIGVCLTGLTLSLFQATQVDPILRPILTWSEPAQAVFAIGVGVSTYFVGWLAARFLCHDLCASVDEKDTPSDGFLN